MCVCVYIYIHDYDSFELMYGRHHHGTVKQLSSNKKGK